MRSLSSSFAVRQWQRLAPIVIGILAALLSANAASAQQSPPGTSSRYLSRFQVADAPAQFDLVQAGFDFAPGAWTPDQAYGGASYNTVMAGEITLRENGAEKVYKAGDTWSDPAGQVHAYGNNGADHAVVYTSLVLPKEAALTTAQGGGATKGIPAGPSSLFLARFPVSAAPSPLDLVQVELGQVPGSWTAVHTHPGAAYNTVIRGQLDVRADGKDTTYGPGASWVNPTGQVHAVGAVSTTPTVAFTTFLVPRGATQVSTPVAAPPPSLPVTGRAGGSMDYAWPASLGLIAIFAGTALRRLRPRSAR
jgi:quercetin dioxygenase-like cupin family protein